MDVYNLTTEEKIIRSTFQLIQNDGTHKLTTKKIAENAGVSEVTLFRKFKTKQQLINVVKEYYLKHLMEKLDEIFNYDEQIDVNNYLRSTFLKIVELSTIELNIFKIAIEEVSFTNNHKKQIPLISRTIIEKLTDYFQLQIDKRRIRKINPHILAINIFGILFQSILLCVFYEQKPKKDINYYVDDFLDIFLNGISIDKESD